MADPITFDPSEFDASLFGLAQTPGLGGSASAPPPSIAPDPMLVTQQAQPGDLGLPPPPQRTMVPVAQTPQMSAKQRIVQLAALAASIGLGPGKGTGLATGAILGQRHIEDLQEQARREAMIQQREEDLIYLRQAHDYEQESEKRRAMLAIGLANMEKALAAASNKAQADQIINLYGTRFTALGMRGYDPNALRAKGYSYIDPGARARAGKALDVFLADPMNAGFLTNPDPNVIIPLDIDGTGHPRRLTFAQWRQLAGRYSAENDNGVQQYWPKGTKADDAANANGIYADLLQQAQAEHKPITPALKADLKEQAIKRAKESAVDPTMVSAQLANIQSQIDARAANKDIQSMNAGIQAQLAQMRVQGEQDKRTQAEGVNQRARESVTSSAQDVISTIDQLLDPATGQLKPAVAGLYGANYASRARSYVPGAGADADALLKRLTSEQVIGLMNEMKSASKTGATGFGQLNRAELELLLAAATTATNRNLSPSAAAREIKRIREKAQAVIDRAQSGVTVPGTTTPAPSGGKSGTLGRLQYQVLGE